MRKFLALAALVLGLASCQQEFNDVAQLGGEVDFQLKVDAAELATRAGVDGVDDKNNAYDSAFGAIDYLQGGNGVDEYRVDWTEVDLRYSLEVYDAGANYEDTDNVKPVKDRMVKIVDAYEPVVFDLRLVPGRNYHFVVFADFVPNGASNDPNVAYQSTLGIHHNIGSDLRSIQIKDDAINDERCDAYFATKEVTVKHQALTTGDIVLQRPYGKLRVIATDLAELNLNVDPAWVEVTYTAQHPQHFNAVTGNVTGFVDGDYGFSSTYNELYKDVNKGGLANHFYNAGYDSGSDAYSTVNADGVKRHTHMTLFTDYILGSNTLGEQTPVQFTMTVYDKANNPIKTTQFNTTIPIERNHLTTIVGNVLTSATEITVTIDDNFANANDPIENNDYYQVVVTDGYELVKAAMEQYKVIMDGDITLTAEDFVKYFAEVNTRAAQTSYTFPNGTQIDLNGYTLTIVNDSNEQPLIVVEEDKTLNIVDNSNEGTGAVVVEGTGAAIENNGTLNIEGGCISGNNNGTPVIENNGEVNITGGVIGDNALENNDGGNINITGGIISGDLSTYVPDGYDVVDNEDGSFTVKESDPIATIGDTEYTILQAAFDAAKNGETIVITRDAILKNTTTLAEGKTVTLDLNGKTLSAADKNVIRNDGGNLTIKNGTITRTGDVVGYSVNNASGEITIENATISRGLYTSGSKMTATNSNISHDQSSRHAIYSWNCEVTINSGAYHNDNAGNATLMAAGSSVVTINGGTFSIANGSSTLGWTSCMIDQNGTAQVIVKGGQFNGGFRINSADTTLTIEGGEFNTNNGSAYTYSSGTVSITGGTYTDDAAKTFAKKYVAEGYVFDNDTNTVVLDVKIAKVGTAEYRKIDDAIAAWTNNTTLTLMADVTLSDVITLKSTEYHILDLSTYTMTAAKGKDAISITAEGRTSASYALDIKADATNPGGITATSKAVVKTTGKSGVKDRPIIRFYNGVFNASNIVSHSGSNGTNCPQFWFYGGVYNGNMSANRALFHFDGGTFNGKFYISVDSSAYALIRGGKFMYLDNLYGSALNSDKFTIGSSKGNYDRGVYVDDEGYIVVGGSAITEFGDQFAAKATNVNKAGSYLPYSSAAEHGLYYTNAEMAIAKHGEANVELKSE